MGPRRVERAIERSRVDQAVLASSTTRAVLLLERASAERGGRLLRRVSLGRTSRIGLVGAARQLEHGGHPGGGSSADATLLLPEVDGNSGRLATPCVARATRRRERSITTAKSRCWRALVAPAAPASCGVVVAWAGGAYAGFRSRTVR